MRGTLHLTAAEDLSWLLRLLAPRIVRSTVGRRTGLGLDETQLQRGLELTVSALEGGRSLSRAELFDVWRRSGLDPAGQRGVHLLSWLAMTGAVVLGPMTDRDQHVVLLSEWVPHPRDLDGDQAFRELAVRYFRSHGPAPATDLTHWARLTAAETRTAVALARPSLAAVDVDGAEHLLDPATPDLLHEHRSEAQGGLTLPGFDELVLGHRDRRAQLDPDHAEKVVPGGNGMFRPTVVHAGRVVGTWSRGRSGSPAGASATPFTRFAPEVEAALPGVLGALP